MSETEKSQLIRPVPKAALAAEVAAFLIDCQARQLSPRTLRFYHTELGLWCSWLGAQNAISPLDITPDLLRGWLVHLQATRNPGGLHASYRSIRAFLNWYENEYEPPGWTSPLRKLSPPRLS